MVVGLALIWHNCSDPSSFSAPQSVVASLMLRGWLVVARARKLLSQRQTPVDVNRDVLAAIVVPRGWNEVSKKRGGQTACDGRESCDIEQ